MDESLDLGAALRSYNGFFHRMIRTQLPHARHV